MLNKFFSLIIIAVVALFSGACREKDNGLPEMQTDVDTRADATLEFVRPDGTTITSINVEIAESVESRATGLMNRRSLDYQTGMLFIFQDTDTLSFWMRNTPVPLDMIFVGPDSQIVNIAKRTRPLSDQSYRSEAPSKYVVEVRGGFTDHFGIDDSTRIRWQRVSS